MSSTSITVTTTNIEASEPPPTPLQPYKPRFRFIADTRAPTELHRVEVENRRRQKEFRNRIASIEQRIALWTAKLARETLDRESATSQLAEQSIVQPLESCLVAVTQQLERDIMNKFTDAREGLLTNLEIRLDELTHNMTALEYDTIHSCTEKHFDSIDTRLQSNTIPNMTLEGLKSTKREGGMVRRFERHAGDSVKCIALESAVRAGTLASDEMASVEDRRTKQFLEEVKMMKENILREREERQRQDQSVLDEIVRTQKMLQKVVLESVAGVNED
mmetsp:Transcript_8571/g.12443  ORF Transcript_8571/g.12443 Transcript_8571/m.12443 type:complete len:276 (+) Transcript_8571:109-936(+)